MESLRRRVSQSQAHMRAELKELTKELTSVQQRSQKLYEAVEKGLLPMDSSLTERANKLQTQTASVATKIAGLRRLKQMPTEALGEKKIHAFTSVLRERLLIKIRVFSRSI